MTAATAVLFGGAGALAGAAHFQLLRRSVELLLSGGSALAAAGLGLGRMALTIAVLALAALNGWAALLSCAAGVLGGRALVLRRPWRVSP